MTFDEVPDYSESRNLKKISSIENYRINKED